MANHQDIHLISWNVAGLKPTLDFMRRFGGLKEFCKRHRVDILCLQEVKVTSKTLAQGRQYEVDGYESYWACNDGNGFQRQGLNGCATFVRKGLNVEAANCAPLESAELDDEGRCLLTDHGSFVVFNVYVPNSQGGPRLPFKLRWLRALRQAMQRERRKGKAVLLAGDLNLKHRRWDSHWSCLSLDQQDLVRGLECGTAEETTLQELRLVAFHWQDLLEAFRNKTVTQMETRNSKNGQTFQKFGIWAKPFRSPSLTSTTSSTSSSAEVRIGPPVEDEGMARCSFPVDGVGVDENGTLQMGDTSVEYVLRRKGELSLGELLEGMKKLGGIEISPAARDYLVQRCQPPSVEAVRTWLQALMADADGMVDSFAEFYPEAKERFTCWDQYRNRRHQNEGSRIDYVMVDRVFFQAHASAGAGLASSGRLSPNSAAAALSAATYDGISQPAPFNGGMPELEEDEYFAQFRADKEGPSSGIVYTPQQLSDHVAVSLLLRQVPVATTANSQQRSQTQRCQPHLKSKRITDFFGRKDLPPLKRQAVAV